MRMTKAERKALIEECARCVPTTWLDPLLSGPNKVGNLSGRETEALLRGIQDRIRALVGSSLEPKP